MTTAWSLRTAPAGATGITQPASTMLMAESGRRLSTNKKALPKQGF
jgi:hypothetical protein